MLPFRGNRHNTLKEGMGCTSSREAGLRIRMGIDSVFDMALGELISFSFLNGGMEAVHQLSSRWFREVGLVFHIPSEWQGQGYLLTNPKFQSTRPTCKAAVPIVDISSEVPESEERII